MESAFGIEHGEISKFSLAGVGTAVGGAAKLGAKKAGSAAGKFKPMSTAGGAKGLAGKAAFSGLKGAGQGAKKISTFAAAKPAMAGGAAVGGAAAGTGFLANAISNRRRF